MRRVQDEHNGVTVSAAQLERWRHFGLLPKVEVRRTGLTNPGCVAERAALAMPLPLAR